MSYFSRAELLMGRDKLHPINQEQSDNLDKLIAAINPVRHAWGKPMRVTSGYRPSSINASVGGATNSAHQSCQAIDIADNDGKLAEWILNNLDILEENGLYLENPDYTIIVNSKGQRISGWVHLQLRKPASGNRVFIPYAGPIKLQVRDSV
jgi:hypothetical protein